MHVAALALVLTAAGAHAVWNLLAKHAGGGVAFMWSYGVAGLVLWAPLGLAALALGHGHVDGASCALMAGSGALHAGYFVLLQRGYATGDLSVVHSTCRSSPTTVVAGIALLAL